MNSKKKMNQQNEYRVGDKVVFFTNEIAMHASVMAGTATSICLNDYPREKAVGTITQIHYKDSEPISYVVFEESGYLCSMVWPEDIVGIVSYE